MASTTSIVPVILSGGSGSRLWPLSRTHYPKQLLPLVAPESLLQETARRVADREKFAAPLVVCNDEHRFIVAEHLRAAGVTPKAIVLEPEGRNTAPAVAVAALLALERADGLLLVMPSDHIVQKPHAFVAGVETARRAAEQGALVTFGVAATRPETGYGYIRAGSVMAGAPGCHRVERFVEKPDRATAERYVAEGGWSWNSGIFLFRASRYLEELERFEPAILAACREAVGARRADLDFTRLDRDAFRRSPAKSLDYAVMEKTKGAAVVPLEIGWSDVGSWSALWEISARDPSGNVAQGDVMLIDVTNSYVRSEKRLVAAVGLDDVVIVATDDAVLVARKDRTQDVRRVVETLKAKRRPEADAHSRIYRPWGYYQSIDEGTRFQVKQICVKPGGKLSLQRHMHRAEHWIVVAGTACVTRDGESFELYENQSTYIPMGSAHRLENRGKVPLTIIEVQSGAYLGEDDIERLDDAYGRSASS